MKHLGQRVISTDESGRSVNITEPQIPAPAASGPYSTSDVVVLSDGDATAGYLSNQNQVHQTDSLSKATTLRNCPSQPDGVDHGITSKVHESSYTSSRCLDVQGEGRSLSSGTQTGTMDSLFYRNSPETSNKSFDDCGSTSNFRSVHDRSIRTEDQGSGVSFSEQNPVSKIDLSFEQSASDASSKIYKRSLSSSERMDSIQEQKSPETNFREHFSDFYLGLGTEHESFVVRFRSPRDDDGFEKPLLNFDKDEWLSEPHSKPVREKLWPDEEPPEPKRSRTSLPEVTLPGMGKSSSSGSSGLPVQKTVCTVDFIMPGSSVFTSKAVSLMQSEEGIHVITEETVAHTVYDDPSGSNFYNMRNGTQNRAVCYQNTKDQGKRTKPADFSVNRSTTTSVPGGSANRRPDVRIEAIILSPSPDTGTVIRRVPSKSSSYSIGKTDRADIAGGWKPLCGQTVVRKPSRPAPKSEGTNSVGIRKPTEPLQDSLWTSFAGAAKKSGQPVPVRDRFGIAGKDQEPGSLSVERNLMSSCNSEWIRKPTEPSRDSSWTGFADAGVKSQKAVPGRERFGIDENNQESSSLSTVRSDIERNTVNTTNSNNPLDLLPVNTAASLNRGGSSKVQDSRPAKAITSSSGDRLESVEVCNKFQNSFIIYPLNNY